MTSVKPYDLEAALEQLGHHENIFGIRHHSPACARMVVEAAEELNPEAIAVELPADLHDCLTWLAHDETTAPIAIAAAVTGDPHSGCLYPFADFSPELAIIRWAHKRNIPVHAIDLPVGAPKHPCVGEDETEVQQHQEHIAEVISQESWDTQVETAVVGQAWHNIQTAALAVGAATRFLQPPDPHTLRREKFMRQALKKLPGVTLVVVGSYHCLGLLDNSADDTTPDLETDWSPVTASVVPYSFAQLDSRSGYAAGIRDPWWQQAVLGKTRAEVVDVVQGVMVSVTRALRKHGHPAGTGETMEAARVALDLASLRKLPSVGRREAIEAVTTVFAHGEILGRGRAVAQALQEVLVGDKRGAVAPAAPHPALVVEVKRQLASVKLPSEIKEPSKTLRVDPFSGHTALKRHVLFKQLEVLGIPYTTDKTEGTQRGLKAQGYTITCTWSPGAETATNLAAAHGVTVEQAVAHILLVTLNEPDVPLDTLLTTLGVAIGCGIDQVVNHVVQELTRNWLNSLSLHQAITVAETLSGVVSATDAGALLLADDTKNRCVSLADELAPIIISSVNGIAGSTDPHDARALGHLMSFGTEYAGLLKHTLRRLKTHGSTLMQGAAYALAPNDDTKALVGSWTDQASKPYLVGFLSALGPAWPDSYLLDEFIDNIETIADSAFINMLPSFRSTFDLTSAGEREAFLDRLYERIGHIDTTLDPQRAVEFATEDARAREVLDALGLMDLSFDPATRWRLILGAQPDQLTGTAQKMATALDELYGFSPHGDASPGDGRITAGHKPGTISARVWKDDIESLFGYQGVQEIFGDALEAGRGDVAAALEPDSVTPSVDSLKTILNLKGALPEARLAKLRPIVARIVSELSKQLATTVRPALTQLTNVKTSTKKSARLALAATIRANLTNVVEHDNRRTIVPVNPRFYQTQTKFSPWHIIVVVDVSGSMEASTIYASMTAAILTQIRTLKVHFVTFDTQVIDLSDHVEDPLSLLLEISVGGGTNIAKGLMYAETLIENPTRTAVILITDFEEYGSINRLVDTVRRLHDDGVKLLGCAALDDSGVATYDEAVARQVASAGMRVAQVTPLELARWVTEVLA